MKNLIVALALATPSALAAQSTISVGGALRLEAFDGDMDRYAEAYAELETGSGFYAGIWLGTLQDAAPDHFETDVYFGYRGSFGLISYDVGYTRYMFDDSGDCCGEVALALDYGLGDQLALRTTLGYYDESGADYAYLTQDVSFQITDKIAPFLGATWYDAGGGRDFELGAKYSFSDTIAASASWNDNADGSSFAELALTWDTDLGSLLGK